MHQDSPYPSDAELVAGLLREEPAAAVAFVRRFGPEIEARLERFGMEASERDLLVDRVAEKVIRNVTGMNPRTNLRSYVAIAALNAGRDWARARARRPRLAAGVDCDELGADDVHVDTVQTDQLDPSSFAGRNRDAVRLMHDAMADLADHEVAVLLLRSEGYEYSEIALMLGGAIGPEKENTWAKRYERAKEKLKRSFSERAARERDEVRALLEGQGLLRPDDASSE